MNFSFYKPRVDSDHRCWQSCCQRGRCFPHPSSIPGNAESEPYVSSCQGFLHRGARFTGGSGTGRPRCSECTSSSACWSSFWGRVRLYAHSFILSVGVWAATECRGAPGPRAGTRKLLMAAKSLLHQVIVTWLFVSSEASVQLCGYLSPFPLPVLPPPLPVLPSPLSSSLRRGLLYSHG